MMMIIWYGGGGGGGIFRADCWHEIERDILYRSLLTPNRSLLGGSKLPLNLLGSNEFVY